MYLQLKNHILSDLNMILRSNIFTFPMLFLFIFIPLYWTLPDYGITSDEPTYQEAAWNIKKWLDLDNRKKFDPEEIDKYWKTDPTCNVHPSGVKWLYLAAQKIIFWEHDASIDDQDLLIVFVNHHILTNFPQTSQGNDAKFFIHFSPLLQHRSGDMRE